MTSNLYMSPCTEVSMEDCSSQHCILTFSFRFVAYRTVRILLHCHWHDGDFPFFRVDWQTQRNDFFPGDDPTTVVDLKSLAVERCSRLFGAVLLILWKTRLSLGKDNERSSICIWRCLSNLIKIPVSILCFNSTMVYLFYLSCFLRKQLLKQVSESPS